MHVTNYNLKRWGKERREGGEALAAFLPPLQPLPPTLLGFHPQYAGSVSVARQNVEVVVLGRTVEPRCLRTIA